MTRRLLAILMALGVIAAACGNDDDSALTAPADDDAGDVDDGDGVEPGTGEVPDIGTINVGYIPILGFAPYFVAQEKGYFEEEGLDVELSEFVSGDPMIAPLSQGQLDVGGGEFGPALMNAVDQDLDVRVVGGLASQPAGLGAVPLMVAEDVADEIGAPADLAGRRVALNVEAGMAEYLLATALDSEGLALDDVVVTNIPFPDMPLALGNNSVDAAMLPFPLAGAALNPEDPSGRILVPGDQITDNPQNGVIYFGQRLLEEENREVGLAFLRAYLRAARDLYGDGWNADDNVTAMSEWTGIDPGPIAGGVPYFFQPEGEINLESVRDIADYHFNAGNTELDEPADLDGIIVTDFLETALASVGPFEAPADAPDGDAPDDEEEPDADDTE